MSQKTQMWLLAERVLGGSAVWTAVKMLRGAAERWASGATPPFAFGISYWAWPRGAGAGERQPNLVVRRLPCAGPPGMGGEDLRFQISKCKLQIAVWACRAA